MGFNSVYQTLKELFPQVDARILKAVAIEHSKDPQGAVESILTDVLPFVSNKSNIPTSGAKNNGKSVVTSFPSSSILGSIARDHASASGPLSEILDNSLVSVKNNGKAVVTSPPSYSNDGHNIDFLCLSEKLDDSLSSSFYDAKDTDDQPSQNAENGELILFELCEEKTIKAGLGKTFDITSVSSIGECCKDDSNQAFENHEGDNQEKKSYVDQTLVSINGQNSVAFDWNLQPQPKSGMPLPDGGNQEINCYLDANFIQESHVTDAFGAEDESVMSTIVTRSGQICSINLLEDIIVNAKNYKDTLFTARESVLRLIEEVELQEKVAEQAKEAAAGGGLEILEKVEKIKMMLKHAKEANGMHAGEVYGERSILATEVRELQTRLLALSDEKDKSLSILNEMRRSLEARLVEAEDERKSAEQEMLEKEKIAQNALAEQELVMAAVVEESKLLQQEADENAKLRDFLMEKGRVVDALQGEISVICQDVKLLKENFDNRSNSLSLKNKSSVVASLNSSVKSTASDTPHGLEELPESPRRVSRSPSVKCQTPATSLVGEVAGTAGATGHKELLDEDWELFDI